MHTLNFLCTQNPHADRQGRLSVSAVIDGKVYKDHLLDVAGILFGGAATHCSFYLFTCECGVAGCAGFHTPLEHKRDGDKIIWKIEDEELASVLGSSEMTFDAYAYDAARRTLYDELLDFEERGVFVETFLREEWNGAEHVLVGRKLAYLAAELLPYYHGQTLMNEAMALASKPSDPKELRFAWDILAYTDDDISPTKSFTTISVVEAACNLLNVGESATPSISDRVECLSAVAQIVRDFYANSDCAAAEAAFKPYRKFRSEDGIDAPDTHLFQRDADGVFIALP